LLKTDTGEQSAPFEPMMRRPTSVRMAEFQSFARFRVRTTPTALCPSREHAMYQHHGRRRFRDLPHSDNFDVAIFER